MSKEIKYIQLFNVFLSDRETASGRKFVSASLNVAKEGDAPRFMNLAIVQNFGEWPSSRGWHRVIVDVANVWVDRQNQDPNKHVIRVRDARFYPTDTKYEIPYDQDELIDKHNQLSGELKTKKITIEDAYVNPDDLDESKTPF